MQVKSQPAGFAAFNCSIARALDIVGEWWTPLILRDLFAGMTRYDEIRKDLGIASNVLATRLKSLVEAGVVTREADPADARSWRYALTEMGRDLFPVILSLMAWGDKWMTAPGAQPVLMVHAGCGQVTAAVPACSVCRQPLALQDLTFLPGPGARSGPGTSRVGKYLVHR